MSCEISRCTGHCCESFYLPYTSREELLEDFKVKQKEDGEMIADMVIHLEGNNFTCRFFDFNTRDCTVYDKRPRMCREYPYGQKCMKAGCTRIMENENAA